MTNGKRNVLAMLALLHGCYGTSTGNPNGDADEVPNPGGGPGIGGPGPGNDPNGGPAIGGGPCRKVGAKELDDAEQTSLGFTAQDVLSLLGPRTQVVHWAAARMGQYGPESGEQALTVGFERTSARARLVDYERDFTGDHIDASCPDAIELDVTTTLQSAQGALNERFVTTLRARSKDLARLDHTFKGALIGGTLRFSGLPPESTVESYHVEMQITRYGLSGTLDGSIAQPASGGTSSVSWTGDIASWGFGPCIDGVGVPLDAMVSGTSGERLLAIVREQSTAKLTWQDATSTDLALSLALSQRGVCALLEEEPHAYDGKVGTLLLRGALSATSTDGHVRATWPVQIAARPVNGTIEKLAFTIDHLNLRQNPELERDYGLYGFDGSRFHSVGVALALELTTGGAWSGDLRVTGFERPDCSTKVEYNDAGTMTGQVSGCPASTMVPVARGVLSD